MTCDKTSAAGDAAALAPLATTPVAVYARLDSMRENMATTNARVHIWSHFAAGYNDHRADLIEGGADPASLDPVRNEVWQGLVPTADLEEIFRFFNRVEDADAERLKGIGFDLPSLSSGDIVTVDGKQWRVKPVGFEEIVAPVAFEEVRS